MEEKEIAFPEWVADPELFANYMKDISCWHEPFPASWDAPSVPEQEPPTPVAPETPKGWSLSSLVGMVWRTFVNDMKLGL